MYYSLSTAWNSQNCKNGYVLIEQIRKLGFARIELGFSISKNSYKQIARCKKQGLIQVDSVHNFCPVPEGFSRVRVTPDFFSLASLDAVERKKAVRLTLESLRTAKDIDAQAFIIHAGRVEMKQKTTALMDMFNQGLKGKKPYIKLLEDMRAERNKKRNPHLHALLLSLEPVLKKAERFKIKLCLENRFYFREIPAFDEFALIFNYYRGCKHLYYWHDVGHAQVSENLGLVKHIGFLDAYKNRLCGLHLHDARGTKDHLAPGQGGFNFMRLRPFLNSNHIRVIEVHRPVTGKAIRQSVKILNKSLSNGTQREEAGPAS
ncbi:MAG: TIM barrel protein [Candidatus Omnitrophota bacterium]